MAHLTVNDLHYTDELDSSAMSRIAGGNGKKNIRMSDLPDSKPTKITLEGGTIVGEWQFVETTIKTPIPLQ